MGAGLLNADKFTDFQPSNLILAVLAAQQLSEVKGSPLNTNFVATESDFVKKCDQVDRGPDNYDSCLDDFPNSNS